MRISWLESFGRALAGLGGTDIVSVTLSLLHQVQSLSSSSRLSALLHTFAAGISTLRGQLTRSL